jgi:hypothetical protein
MFIKRRGLLFILAFCLTLRACANLHIFTIILKYATYMRSQLPSQYPISFRLHNFIHPFSRCRHSPRLVIIYMFTLFRTTHVLVPPDLGPPPNPTSHVYLITRAVGEALSIPHSSVAVVRVYPSSCPLSSDAVDPIQVKLGNLYAGTNPSAEIPAHRQAH